jgi:hypothetical protein
LGEDEAIKEYYKCVGFGGAEGECVVEVGGWFGGELCGAVVYGVWIVGHDCDSYVRNTRREPRMFGVDDVKRKVRLRKRRRCRNEEGPIALQAGSDICCAYYILT